MGIRRWFVWPPLVLALVLAQSYFWVPTYDEQARGNPGRLEEFINASIGDASILNPILSADAASSEINNHVFEGLIDRDENLRFRGRVAESWAVTEEAYLLRQRRARSRRARRRPGPEGVAALLRTALATVPTPCPPGRARGACEHRAIEVEPARTLRRHPAPAAAGAKAAAEVRPGVRPARVKLVLREVDQDLFTRLSEILGPDLSPRSTPRATLSATPAAPRTRAAGARRRAPAGDRAQPGDRVPPPARRGLPRRATGRRARRQVHLRRDHGPAQPVPAGLGLRAGEGPSR